MEIYDGRFEIVTPIKKICYKANDFSSLTSTPGNPLLTDTLRGPTAGSPAFTSTPGNPDLKYIPKEQEDPLVEYETSFSHITPRKKIATTTNGDVELISNYSTNLATITPGGPKFNISIRSSAIATPLGDNKIVEAVQLNYPNEEITQNQKEEMAIHPEIICSNSR